MVNSIKKVGWIREKRQSVGLENQYWNFVQPLNSSIEKPSPRQSFSASKYLQNSPRSTRPRILRKRIETCSWKSPFQIFCLCRLQQCWTPVQVPHRDQIQLQAHCDLKTKFCEYRKTHKHLKCLKCKFTTSACANVNLITPGLTSKRSMAAYTKGFDFFVHCWAQIAPVNDLDGHANWNSQRKRASKLWQTKPGS